MSTMNGIKQEAKRHEILSHEYRIFVMKFLSNKKESTWTELVRELEKFAMKRLNPNSINFHLSRLVDAGYIKKIDKAGEVRYVLVTTQNNK
jgi:DNA-binding PadR family transcriptional regulator